MVKALGTGLSCDPMFVHHNQVCQLPACIIFGPNPEEMTETLLLSKFPSFILSKKRKKVCVFFHEALRLLYFYLLFHL